MKGEERLIYNYNFLGGEQLYIGNDCKLITLMNEIICIFFK